MSNPKSMTIKEASERINRENPNVRMVSIFYHERLGQILRLYHEWGMVDFYCDKLTTCQMYKKASDINDNGEFLMPPSDVS